MTPKITTVNPDRLWKAAWLAPWSGITLATFWIPNQEGIPGFSPFVVLFAYIGVFLVGLPYASVMNRYNKLSMVTLLVGGFFGTYVFSILVNNLLLGASVSKTTFSSKVFVLLPYSTIIALTSGLIVRAPWFRNVNAGSAE